MNEIFAQVSVSDRLHNECLDLEERLIRQDFNLRERASETFGHQTFKEGKYGIGNGPYSAQHKLLRRNWHRAIRNFYGKERMRDSVSANADLICAALTKEMKSTPGMGSRKNFITKYSSFPFKFPEL